jgi:hypothetical protein
MFYKTVRIDAVEGDPGDAAPMTIVNSSIFSNRKQESEWTFC